MTKAEITDAMTLAQSDESLEDVDHTVLHGFMGREFNGRITTTTRVVAKVLRENCIYLSGQVNAEELADVANHLQRKVLIVSSA